MSFSSKIKKPKHREEHYSYCLFSDTRQSERCFWKKAKLQKIGKGQFQKPANNYYQRSAIEVEAHWQEAIPPKE